MKHFFPGTFYGKTLIDLNCVQKMLLSCDVLNKFEMCIEVISSSCNICRSEILKLNVCINIL